MSKISYVLRKVNKGEELGVYVRHSHGNSEFTRATGVNVLAKYFSKGTGKVSSKLPLAPEWNAQIQQVYSDIEKAARNIVGWGEVPDKPTMQKEYDAILALRAANKEKAPKTMAKVGTMLEQLRAKLADLQAQVAETKQQINECENLFNVGLDNLLTAYVGLYKDNPDNQLRPASKRLYDNVIYNLNLWNNRLKFNEVTAETLSGFETYLLSKNLKTLTVRTIMVRLRNVVNTYSDKLDNPESIKKYKLLKPRKSPTVVFLNRAELDELEAMELTGVEAQTRDLFVLLSHTGLRWSDRNFTKDAVQKGVLHLAATKTGTSVQIPLSTKVKAILAHYNYQLPDVPERSFNRVIKAVCSRIETLNEQVTSVEFSGNNVTTKFPRKYTLVGAHTARRTFVNLCLIAKTNPAVIRGWVGHNSLQTLMIYADKQANTKEELAAVFN